MLTSNQLKLCREGLLLCVHGRRAQVERHTEAFWREAEMLAAVNHPNVLRFYGVVLESAQDPSVVGIMTEYMRDGSLAAWLRCAPPPLLPGFQRVCLCRVTWHGAPLKWWHAGNPEGGFGNGTHLAGTSHFDTSLLQVNGVLPKSCGGGQTCRVGLEQRLHIWSGFSLQQSVALSGVSE